MGLGSEMLKGGRLKLKGGRMFKINYTVHRNKLKYCTVYIVLGKTYTILLFNQSSRCKIECSTCFGINDGCSNTFLCIYTGFTFVHTGLPKNRESCVYKCKSCVQTQDFLGNPVSLYPVKVSIFGHRYTGLYFDPFFSSGVCVCIQLRKGLTNILARVSQ